ncbi:19623_t:CDS:2, partial [Racocetra persica]
PAAGTFQRIGAETDKSCGWYQKDAEDDKVGGQFDSGRSCCWNERHHENKNFSTKQSLLYGYLILEESEKQNPARLVK